MAWQLRCFGVRQSFCIFYGMLEVDVELRSGTAEKSLAYPMHPAPQDAARTASTFQQTVAMKVDPKPERAKPILAKLTQVPGVRCSLCDADSCYNLYKDQLHAFLSTHF